MIQRTLEMVFIIILLVWWMKAGFKNAAATPIQEITQAQIEEKAQVQIEIEEKKEIIEEIIENDIIEYSDFQIISWFIKGTESLRYTPYWDVNAWRSGWGTEALNKKEIIDLKEANQRFTDEFNTRYKKIKKKYPKLNKWNTYVITAFKYNVSKIGPGLDEHLKNNNITSAAKKMLEYYNTSEFVNKKGQKIKSKKLDSLVKRRKLESNLMLMGPKERRALGDFYKSKVLSKIDKANKSQ